ncbi:MAG: hypothetical protein LBR42_01640 [Candidatus Methanoplasma sp.]|jgi:hypothetical protein|nr:hypothetical protein [Candidatus Methanoplasma sp.]
MITESINSLFSKKGPDHAGSELADDVLCIDCKRCSTVPDVRSVNCLGCMMHHISQHGNAGRIRLRTGRDLELSGPAAEIICEMAALHGTMDSEFSGTGKRSCGDCMNSRSKIMGMIRSGFPEPNFDSARGRLASFRPSENECNSCIQRTYRALDQTELGLNNLKKKISIEAARTGGS